MARVKEENCDHPRRQRANPKFGHYECKRCGADVTPAERRFTIRHGPATTFSEGDRLRVRATDLMSSYTARFAWAEDTSIGMKYFVAELQTYREGKDGKGRIIEGIAAWRWADPADVSHAPGLRDRRAREAADAATEAAEDSEETATARAGVGR